MTDGPIFTDDELGFPKDEAAFMSRFEQNLSFERKPVYKAKLHVNEIVWALVLATVAAIAVPLLLHGAINQLHALPKFMTAQKTAINAMAFVIAGLLALPKVIEELF